MILSVNNLNFKVSNTARIFQQKNLHLYSICSTKINKMVDEALISNKIEPEDRGTGSLACIFKKNIFVKPFRWVSLGYIVIPNQCFFCYFCISRWLGHLRLAGCICVRELRCGSSGSMGGFNCLNGFALEEIFGA